MENKNRRITPEQIKLALLNALEHLKATAYYEDGYSDDDEECYQMLKQFIHNTNIERLIS